MSATDRYTLHPSQIVFYGTSWCGDCRRARQVFAQNQVPYVEIDIDSDPKGEAFVKQVNHGSRSVPTIVFPDGSTLTEPDNATLAAHLRRFKVSA
ncbi:MAG: NrdH-redoxin [Anaerolineales bacterium]|nr:NrdH-redoxin [Anaerolineales bacterium]MCX7755611.1 NrdH-redoxin [Anaerolineales bacterium]MDW8276606.1 glutaredoxin domain-containing protein [Anaerolineales bacterium]